MKLWAIWAVGLALSSPASATSVGLTSGALIQPGSSYHLLVYGAYGELALFADRLRLRAEALERPRHAFGGGYATQERFALATLGVPMVLDRFFTAVGYGKLSGTTEGPQGATSRYDLEGVVTRLDFQLFKAPLRVAISHQVISVFGDEDQRSAFVAWPFNFWLLSIGYAR